VHLICPGGSTTCKDGTGLETTAASASALTGVGDIQWQVRANFADGSSVEHGPYTATQDFIRTIPPPANPTTDVGASRILLSWDARTGADSYQVQISRSNSFTVNTESFNTQNTSYAPYLTLTDYVNGGTLYWRVAAKDSDNNQGQWTSPASL